MNMYCVEKIDSEDYHKLLDGVLAFSDYFYIIEPHVAPDLIEVSDEPGLKKLLKKWLIDTVIKSSRDYQTSEVYSEDSEDNEIQDKYLCCKESIKVLHQYDSFFSQEADLDMMNVLFFKGDTCVLYTIGGERMLIVNMDILEDIVNTLKCDKWKIEDYPVTLL